LGISLFVIPASFMHAKAAIILCGGQSTRMGCDKAMLPFGPGEVLLQRVVRLVGQAVPPERIVCVAAADQSVPRLPGPVKIVHDANPHSGPLAGLAAGLAALDGRADAAFACGCDVPLLVPALVLRMFQLLGDQQIAAPHDGERFHPLAAVYRIDVLPTAQALLAAGERSLTALLQRCPTQRVPADALRDADPQLGSLASCNTPEEYQSALRTSGFSA
jgi:molybdopterin-guanine dinucleotide biosynthesis protein A